ncbi:hypothetical protein P1X14_21310, partial [Sphingomonas sp. AOB5]|uniref:hypothetical protein n=1 Tax=Sphingomonas sp. AOB5 TaxID=3034017 RepID=UPI0023F871B6
MQVLPRPFAIGRTGTDILAPPEDYAMQFATVGALALDNVFEPDLLDLILRAARLAEWVEDDIEGIGHRQKEADPRASAAMLIALKRPALFDWLSRASGCGPLVGA